MPQTYIQKYTRLIVAGALAGLLIFFSPGSLFILLLAAGMIFFIRRIPDDKERNFLLGIFVAGLSLRVILVLVTMLFCAFQGRLLDYTWLGMPAYTTPYFIDDCGYYTLRALYTSMHWLGKPIPPSALGKGMIDQQYGASGFIYILATFFSLFGYSPVASKFINCLLGTLTVLVVYSITKDIFSGKAAKISAVLAAFLPSLVLWSITNLKEPIFIFFVYVMIWSITRFIKTRRVYYLVVTALAARAQLFIRSGYEEFFYITIAVIAVYFCLIFMLFLLRQKKIILLSLFFCASILSLALARAKVESVVRLSVHRIIVAHQGAVSSGGKFYKLLPDEFYAGPKKSMSGSQFSGMLAKGWVHVLLEPFPWNIKSKALFLSYFQMILWYVLIVMAAIGMGISIRYRFRESFILLLYFFVITSALAVTGGNIGTIFRFRDIITPILLIFSSVGLVNLFAPPVLDGS